jgi:tetratricopeptide (TPR) repeat protein
MFKEALKEADLAIHLTEITDNRNHIYGWTYYNASFSLLKLGEHIKAKEYPIRALEKYPDHLDSYYMLTIIAGDKSEWDDVIKHGNNFIRVWKDHKNFPEKLDMMIENTMSEAPAIYTLIGHAYHGLKAYNKMEECYNNACEMSDDKWLLYWNIGVYHLDKSFDMERAGHFLKLAVKEAPDEYNTWYMLAKYNNKNGFEDEELAALEKIFDLGTQDDFILNRLFSLFIKKGLTNKALTLLNSTKNLSLSLYPDILMLGNKYIEKGELESALNCYMKAVQMKPFSHEAWGILAELSISMGNIDDSSVFIKKALDLKDDNTNYLLLACYIKLKTGDIESHIKYCDKLLSCLSLNKNLTINGFNDLRTLFIEISHSTNISSGNLLRIKDIINELDRYISLAVA